MRVVLDDQQNGIAFLDIVAIILNVLFARGRQDGSFAGHGRVSDRGIGPRGRHTVGTRVVERQVEGEDAALLMDAGKLDFAAEQYC